MMPRALLAGLSALAFALPALSPAAAQDMAITNATIATGKGSGPIEHATVLVRGGQIAAVGTDVAVPTGVKVIDGTGKWVTPGLVAAVTSLGLWDVGAVRASNDVSSGESPFSAALDVAPAINPDSQHILISRAAGITRAASASMPASTIFGGQGAIIDLGADDQAVMRARAFQYVTLGEDGGQLAGGSRVAAHSWLRNALREASQFASDSGVLGNGSVDSRMADFATERRNDALLNRFDAAALVPVITGRQPLYVHVERASDIRAVLELTGEFPKLELVLVGASEGWLVAGEIAAADVPVIADGLDDLPASFEQLAATQSNIGRMVSAGVKVALNTASMEQPRYLAQFAGNLVGLERVPGANGLSWAQAMAAITSVPAAILGLDGKAGVLAPGAVGDLVIWSGDPLEVSSAPLKVFIDGVEQPQGNHQTRLRERYRDLDTSDLPKAYDW